MKTIALHHKYAALPQRVWTLATDYGALQEVMRGLITFKGMPQGRVIQGQHIQVQVSLFGKLPWQPYSMTIAQCDDDAMTFLTLETGAGVKSWRHKLTVTATDVGGSCLTDEIEIGAGMLTPIFAACAKYLYRSRHRPREQLLESGAF